MPKNSSKPEPAPKARASASPKTAHDLLANKVTEATNAGVKTLITINHSPANMERYAAFKRIIRYQIRQKLVDEAAYARHPDERRREISGVVAKVIKGGHHPVASNDHGADLGLRRKG